ncbi:hypothetical protein IAU60_006436 [Kwoniella sp. DSM 27419]
MSYKPASESHPETVLTSGDPFADAPHATLDTDPFADSPRDPFTDHGNPSTVSFGQEPDARAQELNRREADLARREQELARREQGVAGNNWPPCDADMASSVSYLVFITLASFVLWFRPIYLGYCRTEGKAMAIFFSTGAAGLINTISMLSQGHVLAGVFGCIATVGWVIQVLGGGFLYKRNATNQLKNSSIKTIVLHQSRM